MAIKIVGTTIIDDSRSIVDAGISTISGVSINSGIVTSSSQTGIVTYYGDASNLFKNFPLVRNILYVAKNGKDSNEGTRLSEPKATVGAALTGATAGTVIKVSAGTYLENNPLIISSQVSIIGDSLREVSIQPLNQDEDLFYVSNGNYVAEMSYTGSINPGKAIFAFNPNKIDYFDQSPYIQNCTNFIPNSIGLKIDGDHALGPTKSMVLDSYTQYNQGGIGASMTNEGYAQLVSMFTICNDTSVFCGSGAACDLTNSNSSFGNYALVADGVGPIKYTGTITQTAAENSDTFVLDLSTPTLNITNASYDNTTGILTAYTSTAHNFSVGMGVSIVNLEFTCPYEPGSRLYPSGQKGYIFNVKTVAPGRYVDAGNLIVANRTEIVDKSLAAIAIDHPDFFFLGDSANDPSYRFKDSYRLIQKNRQEIIDKSLASIAVGFPSAFNFPTDPVPYRQNRFYDASRLIQINKQEIVDKSLASVAIAHSDFYFPGDAQTSSRSRYYDSYRLIQKNRTVIVDTAWTTTQQTFLLTSSPELKCKRDLGFFVDAVSADIFTGGNNYAKQFTLQYFDAVGNPISNGLIGELTESIFAFNQARTLMKNAITNTLVGAAYSDLTITVDPLTGSNTNPLSCANVRTTIDNLVGIVTTSIGAGNTSLLPSTNLGSFTPGGIKCARDLGFLVDAISTDVFTGGNRYSREFVFQYYNGTTRTGIGTIELAPSLVAFNAAKNYANMAITNQLNLKNIGISSGPATYGGLGIGITVYPSGNSDSCTDVQQNINNLVGIVTVGVGIGTSVASGFPQTTNLGISTTNKCARDIGYFVDAVSTDVFTGGNSYVIGFTKQYFNSVGSATTALLNEESQSIYAFNSVRDYAKKAITNQLNVKDLTITADPLTGSNVSASSCANVQTTINTLVGIATQAIAAGNLDIINSITLNGGTFLTGQSKCRRDIGYIVDAVASDVKNFTNKSILEATKIYFDNSGNPLNIGITTSITAFNAVREYSKLAITNNLNVKDLTLAGDPTNTDPASCANVQANINNLVGILTTFLAQGNLTTPLSLPSVSTASTIFTMNVGVATQPHTYVRNTGTAKIDIFRPFDGQVVYFDKLYYSVGKISIVSGGTGYTESPFVYISSPSTSWGVPASAVAEISNGSITTINIISSGRGYTTAPSITISPPNIGINTATATIEITPSYYPILSSTPVSSGICTITVTDNLPYSIGVGTAVPFFKQSRVLASGHSLEYIGSGTEIANALPTLGGVAIQANETDSRNGGLVVFTSTDQSGNFRIGEGVVINQQTGNISGNSYSKSLFSTMTPFILALGGE
jgi:hypothetical protein